MGDVVLNQLEFIYGLVGINQKEESCSNQYELATRAWIRAAVLGVRDG